MNIVRKNSETIYILKRSSAFFQKKNEDVHFQLNVRLSTDIKLQLFVSLNS